MEPRAHIVRDRDGRERVVLDLVDFQALLDASHDSVAGRVELSAVVSKLTEALATSSDDMVDLDEYLASYDALHRSD